MGIIVSVNSSEKKGTVKQPDTGGVLVADAGLRGDAHAHDGHRQLSLLACESYEEMRLLGAGELPFGVFAENITTQGIVLHTLPVSTRLRVGDCLIEITQLGKECHSNCEIYKKVGKCVMPQKGVFARVLIGGKIAVGNAVEVIEAAE